MKKTEKDPKTAASDPDPYGALKRAAHRVLVWADPAFEYDRLAVTKNFTGSPHVDKDDVTFQYALSLGDFAQSGAASWSWSRRAATSGGSWRRGTAWRAWTGGSRTGCGDTTRLRACPSPGTAFVGMNRDESAVLRHLLREQALGGDRAPPSPGGRRASSPRGRAGDGDGDGTRGKGEARGGVPGGGRGHRWVAPGDIHGPREVFCGDSGDRDGDAVAPADGAGRERVRPFQVDAASVFRLLVEASIGNVWPSVRFLWW